MAAQLVGELAESVMFDHEWIDAAPTLLRDLEDAMDAAMRGNAGASGSTGERASSGDDHPTLRLASFLKFRHEQRHEVNSGSSKGPASRRKSEDVDDESEGGLWLPIDKQSQVSTSRTINPTHTSKNLYRSCFCFYDGKHTAS